MPRKWTEEDRIRLIETLSQVSTMSEAAEKMEVTPKALEMASRRFGLRPSEYLQNVTKIVAAPNVVTILRAENKRLKKALQAAEKIAQIREQEEAELEKFKNSLVEIEVPKWLIRTAAPKSGPGVPIISLNDWHTGETVKAELTAGKNEYNEQVQDTRVRRLTESVLDLTQHHVVNPTYPGIVIVSNGDMDSGDIHDELSATNWADPDMRVRKCAGWQIRFIEEMAKHFNHVFMIVTTGNHGRLTKKMTYKRRTGTSLDAIIAGRVQDHFARDRNVRIEIAPGPHALWSVYGHRYLQAHLDPHSTGVKGGDGIIGSIGPIVRSYVRLSSRARKLGQEFDTLVGAHWHRSFQDGSRIIVSDSLKGFDELAMACGYEYAPPSQELWFHHPARGITHRYSVNVDPIAAKEAGEWIAYFRERLSE